MTGVVRYGDAARSKEAFVSSPAGHGRMGDEWPCRQMIRLLYGAMKPTLPACSNYGRYYRLVLCEYGIYHTFLVMLLPTTLARMTRRAGSAVLSSQVPTKYIRPHYFDGL